MMTLADIAAAVDGESVVDSTASPANVLDVQGVSIDSRKIADGDLYVAIQGERFDGHDFVADAQNAGAAAVLVKANSTTATPRVDTGDTTLALGRLAAWWRQSLPVPVAAITGSNGKTTVKQMVASILLASGRQGAVTEGNLNNHIGLPLSVLSLRAGADFGVFELGMNHPGEIDYLTRIARPDVALINNAAPAHLEGLGDVQSVARAKGEIFAGLKDGGVAVINADDPFVDYWRSLVQQARVVSFGFGNDADITATAVSGTTSSDITIRTPAGSFNVTLDAPGQHNVRNALAATAVTLGLGVGLDHVRAGLQAFEPVAGRLVFSTTSGGARLVNDSYNANPASVGAALDVLCEQPGRRVLVVGDMAELGSQALDFHARVLERAQTLAIETVMTLGPQFKEVINSSALPTTYTGFTDIDDLLAACETVNTSGTSLLVKGSRSMQMERVVEALMQPDTDKSSHTVAPSLADQHLDNKKQIRNAAC